MTTDSRFDAQIRAALLGTPELTDADSRTALATVLDRPGKPARRRLAPVAVLVSAAAVAAVLAVPAVVLPRDDATRPVTRAPLTGQLLGDWQHTVEADGSLAGQWRMDLANDGVLILAAPPTAAVQTDGISFVATDKTLRLDAFVNDACAEVPAGLYRWSVAGSQLTLTVVDDACPQRAGLFAGSWVAVDPS